jgi:hypothetical protein
MSIDDLTKVFLISDNINAIIKIQRWFIGTMVRLKRLPLVLYIIKKYLLSQTILFSKYSKDGRINSCIDEDIIITILIERYPLLIRKPKIRMWYDILVYDKQYNWIPINIKITTMTTADNTGNLAMCVYSYTNENLDIELNKSYDNGKMSKLLIKKLKNKEYNKTHKKDYYFICINKTDCKDIIINSLKGLNILTPNINNLPFQVRWSKNRIFTYKNIKKSITLFIDCMQKPKPSWKETFMRDIREL